MGSSYSYNLSRFDDGIRVRRNKIGRVRPKTEADLALRGDDGESLALTKVDEDGYLGDLEMVEKDNAEIDDEDSEVGPGASEFIGVTA